MQNTKKIPIRLIVPSGLVANNTVSSKVKLDTSYDYVIGGAVYENIDLGVPYQIQIKDNQGVISEFVSSKDYIANNASNHENEKYFRLNLDINKSQEITISVKPLITTGKEGDIELVLIQKRNNISC
jgi:hypothetical protein